MASTSTDVANLALTRMGQKVISDIDSTSDPLSVKCKLIYTQALEEMLTAGPLLGWKFASRRQRKDRESMTITAFDDLVTGSTTTVTATHTLVAGDLVCIEGTTSYDGEYEVLTVTGTTEFSITATFVADDATGTAKWTSDEYAYRFLIPTGFRVSSMQSGGIELTDWIREGVFALTNLADEDVDFRYVQSITTTTLFPPWFTKILILELAIQLTHTLTQDMKFVQQLEFDRDRALSKAKAIYEREQHVQEFSASWQDAGHISDTPENTNGTSASSGWNI